MCVCEGCECVCVSVCVCVCVSVSARVACKSGSWGGKSVPFRELGVLNSGVSS